MYCMAERTKSGTLATPTAFRICAAFPKDCRRTKKAYVSDDETRVSFAVPRISKEKDRQSFRASEISVGLFGLAGSVFVSVLGQFGFAGAKQQGNAPQPGQSDQRVYDAADDSGLPAEDPCYDVEGKEADAAPIQCTDDDQDQRDRVDDHPITPSLSSAKAKGFALIMDKEGAFHATILLMYRKNRE